MSRGGARTSAAYGPRGRAAVVRAERVLAGGIAAHEGGNAETAALAYVNAAIHAADALCIFARGEFSQGEDHRQAVRLLEQVPDGEQLAKHLRVALEAKKRWTYDVGVIGASELKRLARAAQALVDEATRRR